MTNPDTTNLLRKAIARLGARGRGQRYPADLRDRIVAYAHAQARDGATTTAVARGLGVAPFTLTLWLRGSRAMLGDGDEFRAVVIAGPAGRAPRDGIVVETRGGLRIKGLDVAQLVEIVRSVGRSASPGRYASSSIGAQ